MNPKVFVAVSIAASLTLAASGAFADAAADIACFTSDTEDLPLIFFQPL